MELRSLLSFRFIHNFQYRLVVQAFGCWRVYSGDALAYITISLGKIIIWNLTINSLVHHQGGRVSSQHAAHSNTIVVPAWRIHNCNGKFDWKGAKTFWLPWQGVVIIFLFSVECLQDALSMHWLMRYSCHTTYLWLELWYTCTSHTQEWMDIEWKLNHRNRFTEKSSAESLHHKSKCCH